MTKPNISILRKKGNEIIEFKAIKEAKGVGKGAHVLIPKKLEGKLIELYYLHPKYKKCIPTK